MPDRRRWDFYVGDMIEACERIVSYTAGMDQEAFFLGGLRYDATLRNLSVLGEAATHVPDAVRANHPEIPWREIVGTRNRTIHAYLTINNNVIWEIIRDDIPSLETNLRALLDRVKDDDPQDPV